MDEAGSSADRSSAFVRGSSPLGARPWLRNLRRVLLFVPVAGMAGAVQDAGFAEPLPLGQLVDTADAVVAGEITEVGEDDFRLRVVEPLAGRSVQGTLRVAKFETRPQWPRWASYAIGQDLVVFLRRRTRPGRGGGTGDWSIMGRIGEGEVPLNGDFAYFHGRFLDVDGLPQDYHRFHGQTSYVQRVERTTVFDAIRRYRSCWRWTEVEGEEAVAAPTCPPRQIKAFAGTSLLHRYLVRESCESLL